MLDTHDFTPTACHMMMRFGAWTWSLYNSGSVLFIYKYQ